jgi:hypothetical protein
VGAAIASGSQAERGACALFVKALIIINNLIIQFIIFVLLVLNLIIVKAIAVISMQSPSRLDSTVIIPEFILLVF